MNNAIYRKMIEATRLTRAGQLAKASALLQRALRGETQPERAPSPERDGNTAGRPSARIIDLVPDRVELRDAALPPARDAADMDHAAAPALRGFLARFKHLGPAPGLRGRGRPAAPQKRDIVLDDGGQFITHAFSNDAGSRAYKLYIPKAYRGQALPLIVMLHGCTQSPDDFAAGTRMNAHAEEQGCFVAYPAQAASANASKCWNWFIPGDQQRDQGEPSLIAGITRQIMRDYKVDPRRIYVAGLSAGGAAAAIMGASYPDLYAAIGVHSGLACGAAHDMPSAFAAMRQGDAGALCHALGARSPPAHSARIVPTIVFHGDRDSTVHPRNADQVIAQANASSLGVQQQVERGQVDGGHGYSRISFRAGGEAVLEQWVIHGAGHAWSGGSPAGSYTDPRGPDAAREMLRFFLEHPHPAER